jgi:hypothetical protein
MTALALVARTNSSLTIGVTAGAGETQFELEFNRADDFASDDSLFRTGLAAGNAAVAGLPADTPFFVRGRSTNGGVSGAWSIPVLAATLPPAATGAYLGFSIEPSFLIVPEPINEITCAEQAAGSPAVNLLSDDPTALLRSQNGNVTIYAHTAGRLSDGVSLLGTMLDEAATWRIRAADSVAATAAAPTLDSGVVAFRASPNLGMRPSYHGFFRAGAPVAASWWRIDIVNPGPTFIARNLVIGLVRSSVNFSRGAGTAPWDLGSVQRTVYGTPDRVRGWRGRAVDFQLSWLSEAEFEAKWADLDRLVGTTEFVWILPNSKASPYRHDRIGLGTIEQMRAENVRSSKFLRTIEVRSIY